MARRLRIADLCAGQRIHAVGAAGLEAAAMCLYLVERGCRSIVIHDRSRDFHAAFDLAHRFQPEGLARRTRAALELCQDLRSGEEYLRGIGEAEAVLVPQSWFLTPANDVLLPLSEKLVCFPDACFDLFKGRVIGVTGSYGKTTTTRFAAALTRGLVCGNDREACMELSAIERADSSDTMAFELSNRHLRNGFARRLEVGVLTGISLNHEPDHGSFAAYRQTKYSIAGKCGCLLYPEEVTTKYADAGALPAAGGMAFGKRSDSAFRLEGERVVGPEGEVCSFDGLFAFEPVSRMDALAAAAAARCAGVEPRAIQERLPGLARELPRFRRASRTVRGHRAINDGASCMPASTSGLVGELREPSFLICGGDRQLFRPGEFDELASRVATNPSVIGVAAIGPMAPHIRDALVAHGYTRVGMPGSMELAVEEACAAAATARAQLVFSPGCGTGSEYVDKYERGEAFDAALSRLVSGGQAGG